MKTFFASLLVAGVLCLVGCKNESSKSDETPPDLKSVAYEAFIYAYPMMEQIKTVNGMVEFQGLLPNMVSMNKKFPMENVGMPIVAPNFTSMTGGIFIDISGGPVTLEVPEIKDRYFVFQCVDVFTHNFYYISSRTTGGEAGRFTFYNKGQEVSTNDTTPVLLEGDHAIIVIRIDIKDQSALRQPCLNNSR